MNILSGNATTVRLTAMVALVLAVLAWSSTTLAFDAAWRDGYPSPGTYFRYFYVIDQGSGDIAVVVTSDEDGQILGMFRVANFRTGEIDNSTIDYNFAVGVPSHERSFAMVWRPSRGAPANWFNYFYVTDDTTGDIYRVEVDAQKYLVVQVVWEGNILSGQARPISLTRGWLESDFDNVRKMAMIFDTTSEQVMQAFGL